ncbi:MAG: hypothetical protein ABW252_19155 [Polyangiales bacterium]
MPNSLAWAVPLGLFAVLAARVSLVPALAPAGAGHEAARAEVADALRADEPAFRRDALERFPGDPWSQGDHFGARELDRVRELARAQGMRPGAVLDAIDRDVKSHAFDGPLLGDRGRVAVCMPRPFYE